MQQSFLDQEIEDIEIKKFIQGYIVIILCYFLEKCWLLFLREIGD